MLSLISNVKIYANYYAIIIYANYINHHYLFYIHLFIYSLSTAFSTWHISTALQSFGIE